MTTYVEGQGTTAKNSCYRNSCYDPGALTASCNAEYVSDTNGSGIRINGELLATKFLCEDPYRLDADGWQSYETKITLEEDVANQIAAQVAKKLSKQKDPIEKSYDADEVEIPPMSGFVEI